MSGITLAVLYTRLPAGGVDDVAWALAVSDFWWDIYDDVRGQRGRESDGWKKVDAGPFHNDLMADEDIRRLAEMPYGEYLETPEWRARARAVKAFASGRCQVCNSSESLQAHHRTYARRGFERWDDLIALCADCHALFHEHREVDA